MLLFDENISYRVLKKVAQLFPESVHVGSLNLVNTDDLDIWRYAKQQGLAIISKDQDFVAIWERLGAPPKVIWLHTGNSSTEHLVEVLTRRQPEILAFLQAPNPAECMQILS